MNMQVWRQKGRKGSSPWCLLSFYLEVQAGVGVYEGALAFGGLDWGGSRKWR